MGQSEVYEWLKKQRVELHNDNYFTAKQIHEALHNDPQDCPLQGLYGALPKLLRSGFIEYQLGGDKLGLTRNDWYLSYRYKIPLPKKH
jgi:hypothetical protein